MKEMHNLISDFTTFFSIDLPKNTKLFGIYAEDEEPQKRGQV
jgi:hypothetical protein